jgi:hypothetical protein
MFYSKQMRDVPNSVRSSMCRLPSNHISLLKEHPNRLRCL